MQKNSPKHPQQPIILDRRGTPRFMANPIIRQMLEWGRMGTRFDLNTIALWRVRTMDNGPDEDMAQLAQLIGYSVSGFGELSYAPQEDIEAADAAADKLLEERG